MSFPITEFDQENEAFIEPSKVIRPRDMPTYCVLCFFKDVIEKVTAEHNGKVIVPNKWEDGPHPIYEIEYKGKRLAYYHPGIGSGFSVGLLEEAIAYGCKKFIACGGCGVLDKQIGVGHLVCVNAAVRDEGTSYHYLPPTREVDANPSVVESITNIIRNRGIPYVVGKTWTTDAPYRETKGKISQRKAEGCIVVEMEAAGLMAVTQFRKVAFGQILYGGDDLSGTKWDNRDWQNKTQIRENLFWLSVDAVMSL
jgi:uridine phosphorylase